MADRQKYNQRSQRRFGFVFLLTKYFVDSWNCKFLNLHAKSLQSFRSAVQIYFVLQLLRECTMRWAARQRD